MNRIDRLSGIPVSFETSKGYFVMQECIRQVVHHRAQSGVYLRQLNIPIPGSYGPSAGDQSF